MLTPLGSEYACVVFAVAASTQLAAAATKGLDAALLAEEAVVLFDFIVTVYSVALFKPVKIIGDVEPEAVMFPGLAVTV
jgi:hypothetical protein